MFQDSEEDEDEKLKKEQKAIAMENRRLGLLKRSENKRRLRQMHLEQKETSEVEKLQRAKEASALKVRQSELAQRLAEELSYRKHIEQQEFIKKRKAKSKVSSLSSCDVQHLETRLIEEKKREEELRSSKLADVWHLGDDLDLKQQYQKKLKYRRELQNQLIANRRKQREEEEEKHRERKIMEQIVETVRKEDLEAEKHKKDTARHLQAEKEAFLKARQFWKDKRREVLKQEHEVISRMICKKEELERIEAKKVTDARTTKDALVQKLAGEIKEKERRKIEREEICRELYLAQKESDLANEVIRSALNKKHTAKELLQDMTRYRKTLADKKAKEDAIDAAFARHLAEEHRNLEAKERQKEQARREKIIQYGNELRETIRQNQMQSSEGVPSRQCEANTNEEHKTEKNECAVKWNVSGNIPPQKSAICT